MIRLEPWSPGNLPLLEKLLGDPAMMTHLGGPEPLEKIAKRQTRYEQDPRQLRIVDDATGEGIGWVGYWDREWRGGDIAQDRRQAAQQPAPLALALEELRQRGHPELPRAAAAVVSEWTPAQERALAQVINIDQVRRVWIGSLEIT